MAHILDEVLPILGGILAPHGPPAPGAAASYPEKFIGGWRM